MGNVVIEAPDDVFVKDITPPGKVKAGQPLAVLESPNLDRLRSGLVALQEHIAIIERPFLDGRVDEEIATLKAKVQSLNDAAIFSDENVKFAKDRLNVGEVTMDFVNSAKIAAVQARSSHLDARLAASHAERKKTDLLDKISSAKSKLAREQAYLDTMRKGLTISSPFSGTFKVHVAVNAFLKKGQIIGELDT